VAGFAVLDFETTGFDANHHDRVVEVGVVLLSSDGDIEDEWSTLLDPGRDVGRTDIHGICASDVLGAPTFAAIVPRLLRDFRKRVVVSHNISFELRFLGAELRRAGVPLDNPWLTGLCTMKWAGRLLPAASRKLQDCCDAAGVVLANAHCALEDARAAAGLLKYLMECGGAPPPWTSEISGADEFQWPEVASSEVRLAVRGTAAPRRPAGWLDRIVARMPRHDDIRIESYLEVLESALLDHYLSRHEENALVATAEDLGLSRQLLDEIHREYLRSMAAIALADGVVTDDERADLLQVAELVGLTPNQVDTALAMAPVRQACAEFAFAPGDVLCLTGAMRRPRSEWEAELGQRGFVIGSLTRRTRILVAADPDSASGKAKKAREYGIPIINEDALTRLLGPADVLASSSIPASDPLR
jgi:DNA polymerase-3 subunit epsilon